MALEQAKSIEANIHTAIPAPELENEKAAKLSFKEKAKLIFSNITVEPIIICYIIPSMMGALAGENLNLEKACRVDLSLDTQICDSLSNRNASGYPEDIEVKIQRMVASQSSWKNIIQSVFPAFLLMFLGRFVYLIVIFRLMVF